MKIQLIDFNIKMCEQWKIYFSDCSDVVVHHGDYFSLPTDCVVSPANSFGFMDGGLDLILSQKLGWSIQERLQKKIKNSTLGELLVGQVELIETDSKEIPYCLSAPTMRVPMSIMETVNVYLAAKAIFSFIKKNTFIQTITICGLGTGAGMVNFNVCAKQMKQAYDDIFINSDFPTSWQQAKIKHNNLITIK